jgi:hypothetical protein
VTVPKDFGTQKRTWTIVSNGQTNAITMHPRYELGARAGCRSGIRPTKAPVLKFESGGEGADRSAQRLAASLKARVGEALAAHRVGVRRRTHAGGDEWRAPLDFARGKRRPWPRPAPAQQAASSIYRSSSL